MRTSVNDFILVEVVDGAEHLLDCLGGVLLGKLALLADTVEQLAAGGELGHNVEFVLQSDTVSLVGTRARNRVHIPSTRTNRQT